MTSPRTLEAAASDVDSLVRSSLADLPPELLDPGAPRKLYDLFVVLPRDAEFGLAHLALDLLATTLSDWFGSMRLMPPTAYQSEVMVRARVSAPAGERIRLLLGSLLGAVMLDFLGAETSVETAAAIAKPSGPTAAVVQVFFPEDLDLARSATEFGTRDYFRWQLGLGEIDGVGAVTSEPCTALGAVVPGGDLLPPNLMISFAVLGGLEDTVRPAVADLRSRLAGVARSTRIVVALSVTLANSTPEMVASEIAAWTARGHALLDQDERASVAPQETTNLLFDVPASWFAAAA
jgi:hypothetical protein